MIETILVAFLVVAGYVVYLLTDIGGDDDA